jgi:hypothetical protein
MNLKKFQQAKFERRTTSVHVPGMSAFFDEGQPHEIIVQGLNGKEIAMARERVKQNLAVNELVESVLSDKAKSKVKGIQQALGIAGEVPDDHVYRIAVAEFGIVSADFQQEDCVKLASVYPEPFYQITSKILELTGMGQVSSGESNSSGTTDG